MVRLYPSRVVASLRAKLFRNAMACVRSTFHDAPRFSSDVLLMRRTQAASHAHGREPGRGRDWQGFSGAPADASLLLSRSARAWTQLLGGLLDPWRRAVINETRVKQALEAAFARRPEGLATLVPHAALVSNAADVRAALYAAGPSIARLWRD